MMSHSRRPQDGVNDSSWLDGDAFLARVAEGYVVQILNEL